jgi:hypothetical protein
MAEGMTDERLNQIRNTYGAGKPENAGVPTAFRELLGYVDLLRVQLTAAQASERERCRDAVCNSAWKHEGDDAYSAGLDRGAREQVKASVAAIDALSPNPNQEKPE